MFRRNNVAVVPVEELDFVLREAVGMDLAALLSRIDERASEVSSEGEAKIADATSATEAANQAYAEKLAEITQERDTSLDSATVPLRPKAEASSPSERSCVRSASQPASPDGRAEERMKSEKQRKLVDDISDVNLYFRKSSLSSARAVPFNLSTI